MRWAGVQWDEVRKDTECSGLGSEAVRANSKPVGLNLKRSTWAEVMSASKGLTYCSV